MFWKVPPTAQNVLEAVDHNKCSSIWQVSVLRMEGEHMGSVLIQEEVEVVVDMVQEGNNTILDWNVAANWIGSRLRLSFKIAD